MWSGRYVPIVEKMREVRLRWFGPWFRPGLGGRKKNREDFEVEGSRRRGRPSKRRRDVVEGDQRRRGLRRAEEHFITEYCVHCNSALFRLIL